jgi:Domain of unknown function (DUF4402)
VDDLIVCFITKSPKAWGGGTVALPIALTAILSAVTPTFLNAQTISGAAIPLTNAQRQAVGENPIQAQTATAQTAVNVILPLRVNTLTPLNFGRFSPSGVNGTIRISVDGVRTAENVIVGNTVGASALIDVIGPAGATVNFVLPPELILSRAAGPGQMRLRPITLAQTIRIGEDGVSRVALGGILDVAGGQTTGAYSGEFSVTFTYQ